MSAVNGQPPEGLGGGYVTRGRGALLERQLAELEARLMARIDELEHDVGETRGFVVDVLRAQVGSTLEVLRSTTGPGPQRQPSTRPRGGSSV